MPMPKPEYAHLTKIALVGVPNVGKSTLFNKLIGGRRSIVKDEPGITRDRLYAEVNLARWYPELGFLPVCVMDTGGLFAEGDDLAMISGVHKQAEAALNEADLVLFLVDGRVPPGSDDRRIAQLLRKSKKPYILLANKLDSPSQEELGGEFRGLGEVFPFSTQGRKFKSFWRDLIDRFEEMGLLSKSLAYIGKLGEESAQSEDLLASDEIVKIALLGKPNAGKSSLLNKLVGYERALVHEKAGTTRDAIDTLLHFQGRSIMLIDTAGLRRKSKVYGELERFSVDRTIKALVRADLAVLVLDAKEGISHQDQKLAALIQSRKKGCVIAVNKWDTLEKDNETYKAFQERVKYEFNFLSHAPIVLTSALDGQRVNQILEYSLMVWQNLKKRISTGILNNAVREIMAISGGARKQVGKLKIYYATQVDINPPTIALFVNDPKHFEASFGLFLERKLRDEFGFDGAPIVWSVKKSDSKQRA
ncbi:MAG: ribosome biogenesis GTPase Der [Candidatus Caenarcaniphilales bacterium]|nr:ribosome biogenesis GTPase Der [Candidatus Caenarcaniphilales bacterium]